MDLEEISKGIDLGENPIAIRVALADKITECLKVRGALLSPLERVNLGHAIDLLPSTWLRMTWAHVASVGAETEMMDAQREPPESVSIPTLTELQTKLIDALATVDNQLLAQTPP